MKKVIIGVIAKHCHKLKNKSFISEEVKQAVFDNDAIAIGILSPNEEIQYCDDNWTDFEYNINKKDIIDQINLCDGIILQGGLETEAFEAYIASYCYKNDIPILGICAGQNNIVRAVGGTTKRILNPEKHDKMGVDYVHDITIDKDSYFYSIIQKEQIIVNSWHRRIIDDNSILKVAARCEDNYPDVIEDSKKRFFIGVKFHPELLYKKDENMNNIFKEFIRVCKNKSKK